jgi:hypothetical protein
MIERRWFLISCSWMVAALAAGRAEATDASSAASPPMSPPTSPVAKTPHVTLRVQGWDAPVSGEEDSIWISIDGSWRTAWR